jgi:hypothetical protein
MQIHANPQPQHLFVSSPEVSHFIVCSLPVGIDRKLGVGVVDAGIRLIPWLRIPHSFHPYPDPAF